MSCLKQEYGLAAQDLTFLPIGADPNAAVYRAETHHGRAVFIKLRRGEVPRVSLELAAYLHAHGNVQIIPPILTIHGELCAKVGEYTLICMPFIEAKNGYEKAMTAHQWREFGAILRHVHDATYPTRLLAELPRETYAPDWRDRLCNHLAQQTHTTHYDAHATELSQVLHDRHDQIADLIQQASARAGVLTTGLSDDYVVCHTDAHAGNVLLADDAFYLVDWDSPLLALRERDLMFIGGGQGFIGFTPDEEWARFFSGYGDIAINTTALQYYRFERIIIDMVLYCDDLLLTTCGGANRGQALHNLKSNFATGGTIERAYAELPV